MTRVSEQIVELLGVTDDLQEFDEWMCERTVRVRSSAAAGPSALRGELAQLRAELVELRNIPPLPLWKSEALWLEGLIELVGEVAAAEPGDVVMRACA